MDDFFNDNSDSPYDAPAPDDLMAFNGVNGATGNYGFNEQYNLPEVTGEQFGDLLMGNIEAYNPNPANEPLDEAELAELEELRARVAELQDKKARQLELSDAPVKDGVDPADLSQTGWGIIFTHHADPKIEEALQPLLDLRQQQAGKYFRIFKGGDGYRPRDTKIKFLKRHDVSFGPVDPEKGVPYYLLIVGSPEDIPFDFQFQLQVQFAVGRIHFDTVEEYRNYARSVVAAESGQVSLPRDLTFFRVENNNDRATQLSAKYLIQPVKSAVESFSEKILVVDENGQAETDAQGDKVYRTKDFSDWQISLYEADQATKSQLGRLMGGDQTPTLLFTASHGMEYPKDDANQLCCQGAILCQDWPGPENWRGKPIADDFYFAGRDIDPQANLLGMISVFFACYGAGVPTYDEFSKQARKKRMPIAPKPFLAQLPTKMLSHENGGALAVVGHVERAWGYSFIGGRNSSQTAAFEDLTSKLLKGLPVGYAIESINIRYAELGSEISYASEELEYDRNFMRPNEMAGLWTAHNDARDYIVIGDPAVRLPVAEPDQQPTGRDGVDLAAFDPASGAGAATSAGTAPTDGGGDSGASFGGPAANTSDAEQSFGWFSRDEPKEAENNQLRESMSGIADKLQRMLINALDDITSLEVMTYTSNELEAAKYDYDTKRLAGDAKLRAFTRISVDGDVLNLVPKQGENDNSTVIDRELWGTHREMVELAQQNRIEFIKAVGEIATSLVDVLK